MWYVIIIKDIMANHKLVKVLLNYDIFYVIIIKDIAKLNMTDDWHYKIFIEITFGSNQYSHFHR